MKLNLLFYVGENIHTLKETFEFLKINADNVKALSAYPVLLYPGSRLSSSLEDITSYGGSLVNDAEWVSMHLTPVNPSHDFTYAKLHDVGILLGKSFQTSRTFYAQKSQGYYSPGTTYKDFEKLVQKLDIKQLPFSMNEKEIVQARRELSQILSSK